MAVLGVALVVFAFTGTAGARPQDAILGEFVGVAGLLQIEFISVMRAGLRMRDSRKPLLDTCEILGRAAREARQAEQAVREISLALAQRMDERMALEREVLEEKWEAEWEERKIEIYELAYKAAMDQQKVGSLQWDEIEEHLRAAHSTGEDEGTV